VAAVAEIGAALDGNAGGRTDLLSPQHRTVVPEIAMRRSGGRRIIQVWRID
jgi:hypothetical protein